MVKHVGHYLYNMMLEDASTDLSLDVQGEEIRCHSLVASCQGGLLKELLKNKDPQKDTSISFEDIAPRIMRMLLE